MSTPSIKFKKMLCTYDRNTRHQILSKLMLWLQQQKVHDINANSCYNSFQEAFQVNTWASNVEFKDHYFWFTMSNHDNCISFQEIIKAKLQEPKANVAVIIKDEHAPARKAIPKKIRGEAWKIQFGDSTKGACYCCKKELDVFEDWHAGHIIAHTNGGKDTANNLRPLCGSCNLSMGTENMDSFKIRCYPEVTPVISLEYVNTSKNITDIKPVVPPDYINMLQPKIETKNNNLNISPLSRFGGGLVKLG
jgi:hypothetical protein